MYIICLVFLILTATIGLCSLISTIADLLYSGKDDAQIILKDMDAENTEDRIRRAVRMSRYMKGCTVVCVCDKNSPAYEIARLMQKDYPFIRIIEKES